MTALATIDPVADEDDLAEESIVQAKRKWAVKAIGHAVARLYYSEVMRGSDASRRQADDGADALIVASELLPEPHRGELRRLWSRVNEAMAIAIGHPDDGVLQSVSDEAKRIEAALLGEATP